MANTIITKNSSTASAVPTSGQLVQGELAVNVTDKRLFTENSAGTVVEVGVNPSSITTGNLTASGTVTIPDNAISGDKVEGGTINAVTVNTLTSGAVDINGGAVDGTTVGATTPSTGAFTTLSASGATTLSTLRVASILDASGGATTTINGFTPTVSNMAGRNRIINGDMRIDQRNAGASSTVAGDYNTVDRFRVGNNTNTGTIQRITSTFSGFQNSIKYTAAGSTTFFQLGQQIEFSNCSDLQNQTVTISFRAKANNANAGSTAFTVRTRTVAGVDGATIFSGNNVDTAITLTTTAATYSVTRTLPATFGALSVEFVLGSHVSGDGFEITGVQLEEGSVATPFERRPIGVELALCQRYYFNGGNTWAGIFSTATTARYSGAYPIPMRATPTVLAIAAPIATNPTVSDAQTGSQTTSFQAPGAGGLINATSASKIQFGGFTSAADGRASVLTNDCLSFSSEL